MCGEYRSGLRTQPCEAPMLPLSVEKVWPATLTICLSFSPGSSCTWIYSGSGSGACQQACTAQWCKMQHYNPQTVFSCICLFPHFLCSFRLSVQPENMWGKKLKWNPLLLFTGKCANVWFRGWMERADISSSSVCRCKNNWSRSLHFFGLLFLGPDLVFL